MQPSLFQTPWPYLALFPLLFAIIASGVLFLLSTISGWRTLARTFPAPGTASANPANQANKKLGGSSGFVGRAILPVRYRNCLTITLTASGLGIAVAPVFRLFHPPLFIPWAAIDSIILTQSAPLQVHTIRLQGCRQVIALTGTTGQTVANTYSQIQT